MSTALVVRPVRLVRVARVAAVVVLLVFVAVAIALGTAGDGPVRPGQLRFGLADQLAMVGLGVLGAGVVLLFARPRVQADSDGVTVRNVLGETHVPWAVVTAVRLDDGEPWARLDLADDDQLSVMALQANDGAHAVEAVLALRRLLAAHHRPAPDPAPEPVPDLATDMGDLGDLPPSDPTPGQTG